MNMATNEGEATEGKQNDDTTGEELDKRSEGEITASGDVSEVEAATSSNKIEAASEKSASRNDANAQDTIAPAKSSDGSIDKDANDNEEDDVPSDFFDDFSNADFMEGLDIVDAWDDDGIKMKSPIKPRNRSKTANRKYRKRRSRSQSFVDLTDELDGRLSRKRKSRSRSPRGKSKEVKRSTDSRRDPEKTRRDLERYKEKCEKDKEQKLISERLQVVETGLVPPGMEMEVNITEIKKKVKEENARLHRGRSKDEARDVPSIRERQSSRGKENKRSREKVGSTSESGRKFSRGAEWSKDERTRERGGTINRERERRSRDEVSREQRISREKEERRRVRGSPEYRDRVWSPPKRRYRRSRSRSRSPSIRESWLRNSSRGILEVSRRQKKKPEEKLSFLEELQIRLHEQSSQAIHVSAVPPGASHNLIPLVNHYQQTTMGNEYMGQPHPQSQYLPAEVHQYDQSFFIGEPQPVPCPDLYNQQHMGVPGPAAPVNNFYNVSFSENAVPQNNFGANSANSLEISSALFGGKKPEVSSTQFGNVNIDAAIEAARLFEEKKISLSDYLAMTAKSEAAPSTPEYIQKKIKVISRCQDVLKLLGNKKYVGKLRAKIQEKPKKYVDSTNVSPLLKRTPIKFAFTTPSKSNETNTFASQLYNVLYKAGIVLDEVDEEDGEKPSQPPSAPNVSKNKKQKLLPVSTGKEKNVLQKMVQTVPFKCLECEKRKVAHTTTSTQCAVVEVACVGTQVTEADFSVKSNLMNQSLAYLTPAQLLGKESSSPEKKKFLEARESLRELAGRSRREWVDPRRETWDIIPNAAAGMQFWNQTASHGQQPPDNWYDFRR